MTNAMSSAVASLSNSATWWQVVLIIFSVAAAIIFVMFASAKSKRSFSLSKQDGFKISGSDDSSIINLSNINKLFDVFDTCYNLKYVVSVNKQKKYSKDQLLIFRGKVERKFNELLQSFDKYKESLSPSTSFEFLRFKSCYQIFELLLESDLEETFRENNFKQYTQEDFQIKIEGKISKYFEFYAGSINSSFIFENQTASVVSSEDVLKMFRLNFFDKQNSTERRTSDDFIKLIYDILIKAKDISIETYKNIEDIKAKNIVGYVNEEKT